MTRTRWSTRSGAPVAYCYAATYPDQTGALAYLDEPLPGFNLDHYARFTPDNPIVYSWYPFLSRDNVPELLISGKEREFFDWFTGQGNILADPRPVTEQDKDVYLRRFASGRETLCENMRGLIGVAVDGVFADYVVLPAVNLIISLTESTSETPASSVTRSRRRTTSSPNDSGCGQDRHRGARRGWWARRAHAADGPRVRRRRDRPGDTRG